LGFDPDDSEARHVATNEHHSEWLEAGTLAKKEVGYYKAWGKMNRASRKTLRIGRKIRKIDPTTVAGLLVRVRVIETHDELFKLDQTDQLLTEIRDFARGVSRRIADGLLCESEIAARPKVLASL
jgi:hypothetical protein